MVKRIYAPELWQEGRFFVTQILQDAKSNRRNAGYTLVERVSGDVFLSAESGNRQARIVKAIETLRSKGELGLIRNPRHIGFLEAGGTNVTL